MRQRRGPVDHDDDRLRGSRTGRIDEEPLAVRRNVILVSARDTKARADGADGPRFKEWQGRVGFEDCGGPNGCRHQTLVDAEIEEFLPVVSPFWFDAPMIGHPPLRGSRTTKLTNIHLKRSCFIGFVSQRPAIW